MPIFFYKKMNGCKPYPKVKFTTLFLLIYWAQPVTEQLCCEVRSAKVVLFKSDASLLVIGLFVICLYRTKSASEETRSAFERRMTE